MKINTILNAKRFLMMLLLGLVVPSQQLLQAAEESKEHEGVETLATDANGAAEGTSTGARYIPLAERNNNSAKPKKTSSLEQLNLFSHFSQISNFLSPKDSTRLSLTSRQMHNKVQQIIIRKIYIWVNRVVGSCLSDDQKRLAAETLLAANPTLSTADNISYEDTINAIRYALEGNNRPAARAVNEIKTIFVQDAITQARQILHPEGAPALTRDQAIQAAREHENQLVGCAMHVIWQLENPYSRHWYFILPDGNRESWSTYVLQTTESFSLHLNCLFYDFDQHYTDLAIELMPSNNSDRQYIHNRIDSNLIIITAKPIKLLYLANSSNTLLDMPNCSDFSIYSGPILNGDWQCLESLMIFKNKTSNLSGFFPNLKNLSLNEEESALTSIKDFNAPKLCSYSLDKLKQLVKNNRTALGLPPEEDDAVVEPVANQSQADPIADLPDLEYVASEPAQTLAQKVACKITTFFSKFSLPSMYAGYLPKSRFETTAHLLQSAYLPRLEYVPAEREEEVAEDPDYEYQG